MVEKIIPRDIIPQTSIEPSELVRILNGEVFLVEEPKGIIPREPTYKAQVYNPRSGQIETLGYVTHD